jgi:adenine-specific DNA-methyltransferase
MHLLPLELRDLVDVEPQEEDERYLTEQLITYIGNKRGLLSFIGHGLDRVKRRLGRRKLVAFDAFSGSGVVSRYLKQHSSHIIANDIERYAEVIGRCYLSNRSEIDWAGLSEAYDWISSVLTSAPLRRGFIAELYAPEDDVNIKPGERVFYTRRNAEYLDTARQLIDEVPREYRIYLLAPLIAEASVHANTSGVFKGFYKNRATGIGQFGGTGEDALSRILGDIELQLPVLSRFECGYEVHRRDIGELIDEIPEVDVAYLDPPYNQHPYGSNYFMLNLLVDYARPANISRVSGIPNDWTRSDFNKKPRAAAALRSLLERLRAAFILVSYNSEGFISREEIMKIMTAIGRVEALETRYNTFRGSRNLRDRSIYVSEYLFLVEKR